MSVAVVLGVIHNHASFGTIHAPHHCTACDWQVAGTSDVPVVDTPIPVEHEIYEPMLIVQSVFVPNIYLSLFHSRAPPVTPA